MSTLSLNNLGKRFASGWVFRHLAGSYSDGDRVAVTGYNGSGKSTLLKLLAGMLTPDEGQAVLSGRAGTVPSHALHRHMTFAAPYIDLIEEYTPLELLRFYGRFKTPVAGPVEKLIENTGLPRDSRIRIRELSSGLKQRLRLVTALCFKSELLLLDEPGTNLDDEGLGWLRKLLESRAGEGILFIASNDPGRDAAQCNQAIDITAHKAARQEQE